VPRDMGCGGMLSAQSYKDVLNSLTSAFKQRYDTSKGQYVRMVGILFARPSSPVAKTEVVPSLDDYSSRSADNIDFFLPGYCLEPDPGQHQLEYQGSHYEFQRVAGPRGWVFSPDLFDRFRRELEAMTAWQYKGGTELVLANARFDDAKDEAFIDFSTTVVCQLDTMKKDGAIDSVEMFFQGIFRFAENSKGDDPTWGFSDAEGIRIGGSALRRVVLSLLPKGLGKDVEKAVHFAARDSRR
jgi:hypothetical protein